MRSGFPGRFLLLARSFRMRFGNLPCREVPARIKWKVWADVRGGMGWTVW